MTERVRRSNRSDSVPVIGVMMMVGRNSAITIAPSQVPDPVISHTSQPWASRCTQVPISETVFPAVNKAKFRLEKMLRVAVKSNRRDGMTVYRMPINARRSKIVFKILCQFWRDRLKPWWLASNPKRS